MIFSRAGSWSKSKYISGIAAQTFNNMPADGEGKLQVISCSFDRQGLIKFVSHRDGSEISVANDGSLVHHFCGLSGATFRIASPEIKTLNVSLESKCLDTGETEIQQGVVEVYSQNMCRYFGTVTPTG